MLAGPTPLEAELSETDRALISYAIQLTHQPASVDRETVDNLKRVGLTDRAIHDACHVIAYFNYVNRIADGLGVELEEDRAPLKLDDARGQSDKEVDPG